MSLTKSERIVIAHGAILHKESEGYLDITLLDGTVGRRHISYGTLVIGNSKFADRYWLINKINIREVFPLNL